MSSARIDIDKLALKVMQELDDYKYTTVECMTEAVTNTAKETVSTLRRTSPVRTSKYSKSWKYKRDPDARGHERFDMVVFAEAPRYRQTHLLEKGHALKRGGRVIGHVPAQPHIAAADEAAEQILVENFISILSKSI